MSGSGGQTPGLPPAPDNGQVGINLTWLIPGVVGGSEEYSIRLLEGLGPLLPSKVTVRIYGRRDLFETYSGLGDRYETVPMPHQSMSKIRRTILEQNWLARLSRDDHVVHHMGGTVPLRRARSGQRQIVTIHDLQPLDMPHNFHWTKRRWLGHMIPRAAQTADVVVCPSNFTANRLQSELSIAGSKVVVVPHGYEAPALDPLVDLAALDGGSDSATQTRLSGRTFLLYPAIAYKHKRHRDIVEAVARLAASPDQFDRSAADQLHVVFTGRRGPESVDLDRLIVARGLKDRVHVLGRVPEDELDWLYRHATALVFPSEYEGFGNPCLEAMTRGCPVLASSAGALPEVVGKAGLLFAVGDHESIADAISTVMTEPHVVADLVAAGRQQATRFTPTMASEQLWAVYRKLLNAASTPMPGGPSAEAVEGTAGDAAESLPRRP